MEMKRFVLRVNVTETWEVELHAESEEEAKEQFKIRGILDEHRYVSDDLIESNTAIASIQQEGYVGEN